MELTTTVEREGCLTVLDDGPGIPVEHRARLFERFYQVEGEEHRSGTGLGLFISQRIVALHGGQITAEFPNNGGTRFVVIIPTLVRSLGNRHQSDNALPSPLP